MCNYGHYIMKFESLISAVSNRVTMSEMWLSMFNAVIKRATNDVRATV